MTRTKFNPLQLVAAVVSFLSLNACVNANLFGTQAELGNSTVPTNQSWTTSVGCVGVYSDTGWTSGNGEYIGANWDGDYCILAPAHLAAFYDARGIETESTKFMVGNSLYQGNTKYTVKSVSLHPNYVLGSGAGNSMDYAILTIDKSTPLIGVEKALLYSEIVALGTQYWSCGYGTPGTVSSGFSNWDGVKRVGINVIHYRGLGASIDTNYILSKFNQPGTGDYLLGEWQGSQFGSGSGIFIDGLSGQKLLAGLASFVLPDTPTWGSYTGIASVYDALPWIYETTGITAVPEPATLCLLGMGSAWVLRRKRSA